MLILRKIFSHINIDKIELSKDFYVKMDTGEDCKYSINYNPEYVISMDFLGQKKNRTNKCGWLRDKNYFFKNLLKEHPEIFSEENKIAIAEGDQPLVDNKFIEHFPEYKEFIGDELIHHHIGEDGQAVSLPASIHRGYGIVHNAEKNIGVTEAGRQFSQEVQKDFDIGITFTWDKAEVIIKRCVNQNSINEKETSKEKTNENSQQNQNEKIKLSKKIYKYFNKKADDNDFKLFEEKVKHAWELTKFTFKALELVAELGTQILPDKSNGVKGNSNDVDDNYTEGTLYDAADNYTECTPKVAADNYIKGTPKGAADNYTKGTPKVTADNYTKDTHTNNITHASPNEHVVKGHGQHYNTNEGRIWKEKDPFHRGKKEEEKKE